MPHFFVGLFPTELGPNRIPFMNYRAIVGVVLVVIALKKASTIAMYQIDDFINDDGLGSAVFRLRVAFQSQCNGVPEPTIANVVEGILVAATDNVVHMQGGGGSFHSLGVCVYVRGFASNGHDIDEVVAVASVAAGTYHHFPSAVLHHVTICFLRSRSPALPQHTFFHREGRRSQLFCLSTGEESHEKGNRTKQNMLDDSLTHLDIKSYGSAI